jgi:hypothetical protein
LRKPSVLIIALLLSIAVALLYYSLSLGVNIGAEWYTYKAADQWHMNNYFVIDAVYAYSFFGLAALALGGLFTGLTFSAFRVHNRTIKQTLLQVTSFFTAIVFTGLGFNTLNFMLGSFYWTNMQNPPPIAVPLLGSVDVWNFYFGFFLIPLYAGGLFAGLAITHYACVYRPYQAAAAYIHKKNLTQLIHPKKEYLAESSVLTRKRPPSNLN